MNRVTSTQRVCNGIVDTSNMYHFESILRKPRTPAHNLRIVALVQETKILVVGLDHEGVSQQQAVKVGHCLDHTKRLLLISTPPALGCAEGM